MTAQVSLRLSAELAAQLADTARQRRTSVNTLLTQLVRALVEPDFAGSEVAALRERLARAGLLMTPDPAAIRPSRRAVAKARRALSGGKPLSEIIIEDRR